MSLKSHIHDGKKLKINENRIHVHRYFIIARIGLTYIQLHLIVLKKGCTTADMYANKDN